MPLHPPRSSPAPPSMRPHDPQIARVLTHTMWRWHAGDAGRGRGGWHRGSRSDIQGPPRPRTRAGANV
eukprot:808370-Prymnesium_polylepis.1